MKSFSDKRRLAEKLVRALVFQHQKLALDGSDGLLRDVAILRGQIGGVFGDKGQDRAQVLHVEQQQPLLVGDLEGDIQHALLDVVQIHHAGEQQRSHFRDGGAHRMALLPEYIPKHRRELVRLEGEVHFLGALEDEVLGLTGFGDAGEVALDVGCEYGNAGPGKPFRHHLQRHGFSGSGGSGDQTVPVCKPERQPGRLFTLAYENFIVGIAGLGLGRCHRIASSRA